MWEMASEFTNMTVKDREILGQFIEHVVTQQKQKATGL